jgi:large subunit ribosomal protein L23
LLAFGIDVMPSNPLSNYRWDKTTYDAAKEDQKVEQEKYMPDAVKKPPADRRSIAEQAKALLSGEVKWEPRKWQDIGTIVEVEEDGRRTDDQRRTE